MSRSVRTTAASVTGSLPVILPSCARSPSTSLVATDQHASACGLVARKLPGTMTICCLFLLVVFMRSPWPYRLERWRDKALAAMDAGLKERADDDPVQAGLAAAHQRVGELSMENELLRAKIQRLENGGSFHRARSRR